MKKILSFTLVLILLLGTLSVSAMSISERFDPDNEYKYEEIIIPQVFQQYQLEDPYFEIRYREGYEYYSPDSATYDEATPDYVIVYVNCNLAYGMSSIDILGDYVLRESSGSIPYPYGKCIYVPTEDKIYSIPEAYEMNLEGIEKIFTEAGVGELIGDVDKDRELSIKDATHIQKCLAGLTEFDRYDMTDEFVWAEGTALCAISDFNRDGERNIKDATAIQKCLAGLEY
ncbi:MAG: hypothetical protein IJ298_01915 [Ruminococcus sp.]|nr:hypothetical protein [Ruminococcus sp.]